jgi:hypothetical protein
LREGKVTLSFDEVVAMATQMWDDCYTNYNVTAASSALLECPLPANNNEKVMYEFIGR